MKARRPRVEPERQKPARGSSGRTPASEPIEIPAPSALRSAEFVRGGVEYLVLSYGVEPPRLPETLTPAEQAVVRAILDGESNAAIARARGTSARTVANQIAAIFEKVGVSSRAELVAALRRQDA